VARKLVNVCAVIALMMGCWGGVLAAAACPHVGCEMVAAAPDATAAHGEHVDERSHHSASPEDHSRYGATHGEGHSTEPPAQNPPRFDSDQLRGTASDRHDPNCAHCVGSAEAPPPWSLEWRTNFSKNGGKLTAPRAAEQVPAPAIMWVQEITPAQHAPPRRSNRHLLLSVFRI
jgi:hypothetical protein